MSYESAPVEGMTSSGGRSELLLSVEISEDLPMLEVESMMQVDRQVRNNVLALRLTESCKEL